MSTPTQHATQLNTKANHIHRWVKLGESMRGNIRYRCAAPNCYATKDKRELVGKQSECNGCGQPFILDHYALKRSEPKCMNCRNTDKGRQYRAAHEKATEAINNMAKLFGEQHPQGGPEGDK